VYGDIEKPSEPNVFSEDKWGAGTPGIESFSYLGSFVTSDGKCDKEISRKIRMAKTIFHSMGNVLLNMRLKLETRIWVGLLQKGTAGLRLVSFVAWMRGMDYFKDSAKETAGNRNVVFEKDAENLVDGKEAIRNY